MKSIYHLVSSLEDVFVREPQRCQTVAVSLQKNQKS